MKSAGTYRLVVAANSADKKVQRLHLGMTRTPTYLHTMTRKDRLERNDPTGSKKYYYKVY